MNIRAAIALLHRPFCILSRASLASSLFSALWSSALFFMDSLDSLSAAAISPSRDVEIRAVVEFEDGNCVWSWGRTMSADFPPSSLPTRFLRPWGCGLHSVEEAAKERMNYQNKQFYSKIILLTFELENHVRIILIFNSAFFSLQNIYSTRVFRDFPSQHFHFIAKSYDLQGIRVAPWVVLSGVWTCTGTPENELV